jgi:hypothetical protein
MLRFLHFFAMAWLVRLTVPADARFLHWAIWQPLRRCGEYSLLVFCWGTFLALTAQLIVAQHEESVLLQIGVSLGGLTILTAAAYAAAWFRRGSTSEGAA